MGHVMAHVKVAVQPVLGHVQELVLAVQPLVQEPAVVVVNIPVLTPIVKNSPIESYSVFYML